MAAATQQLHLCKTDTNHYVVVMPGVPDGQACHLALISALVRLILGLHDDAMLEDALLSDPK